MSEIRINKIQSMQQQAQPQKNQKEDAPEQQIAEKPNLNRKEASEVLDYMAGSAAALQGGKKINVNKYVDNESAQRIEKAVQAFEQKIFKSAELVIEEFGLNGDAAQDVAILAFAQKHLV